MAIAIAMVATVGLFAIPAARGAFTGAGIALSPGKYTSTTTYIPGETITITLTATPADSIDLLIQNASGTPSASITGLVMPTSGQRVVQWTVPSTWPDGFTYSVQAHDTTSGQTRTRFFAIETYNLNVWTNRGSYLPGDSVTAWWSATYIKDGTAAPDGVGALEVQDNVGNNLLSVQQVNFTASQGNYTFVLSGSLAPGTRGWVYVWFNDTAGLRQTYNVATFLVNQLGILVVVQRGTYAPSDVVSVSIYTRVTANPANTRQTDPVAPNIPVSVNVTDLSTAAVVAAYSATGLTSDSNGYLNYVFQLNPTPTSGDYEVDATATAHGVLSATSSDTFTVQATASLSVQIVLNKLQYMSGDTIGAQAQVFATGSPTLTYTWEVQDAASGNILAAPAASASASFSFTTLSTYQGNLYISVLANDGNGTTAFDSATAHVAFGYLALTLDKSQFNAGDTITASFSLQSNVIVNPTYYWEVVDAGGATAASGSTTGGSASFLTPNPSSTQYTFTVTASSNGRTVSASQTAAQAAGYFLSISLDRSSYNGGDTMTISYQITTRGTAVLPAQYHFYVSLYGVAYKFVDTTSPTGTLQLTVPQGTPTGDLILYVAEGNTGAAIYDIVHVGPVNPLVADVAGVPLFAILIFLLFLVLLFAVILLWRRVGMGKAPAGMETGKPAPPPPPPSQQSQAGGPMTVACKHCGASIEITTSKRPIEVMCPSCGETQVVQ